MPGFFTESPREISLRGGIRFPLPGLGSNFPLPGLNTLLFPFPGFGRVVFFPGLGTKVPLPGLKTLLLPGFEGRVCFPGFGTNLPVFGFRSGIFTLGIFRSGTLRLGTRGFRSLVSNLSPLVFPKCGSLVPGRVVLGATLKDGFDFDLLEPRLMTLGVDLSEMFLNTFREGRDLLSEDDWGRLLCDRLLLERLELLERLGRLEDCLELSRLLRLDELLRLEDFLDDLSAAIAGAPQIPPINASDSRTRNGRLSKRTLFWIIMTLPFWLNRKIGRAHV